MTYTLRFGRIGRTRNLSLTAEAAEPAMLVDAVYKYARRYLRSSDYAVVVDMDAMSGHIEAGRYGTFTIEAVEGV